MDLRLVDAVKEPGQDKPEKGHASEDDVTRSQERPFVLGIAGGSCSGKTTITARLVEMLDDRSLLVMHMDRYFKKEVPIHRSPYTGEEFGDHNHPNCFHLDALMRDLEGHIAENAVQVIIVEGLLTLQHDPLRELLDLKVYLETRSYDRVARRLNRTMSAGRTYEQAAPYILNSVCFRHEEIIEPSRWHADIMLNGSYPSEVSLAMVVEWVKSQTLEPEQVTHVTPADHDHRPPPVTRRYGR